MTYYAIAHTYGADTRRADNRRMGIMIRFDAAGARDAWCAAGPAYRTDYRYREALASDDPDISYFSRDWGGIVDHADLSDPHYAAWI